MHQIVETVNGNGLYLRVIELFRNYFSNSQSKEQLRNRSKMFYRFLAPLFLNNGPRRKQDEHVLGKLEFYASQIQPGQHVIDVGCFDGYFSEKLREHGCDVIGVDALDLVLQKTLKKDSDGKYAVAFAEALPFENKQFDVGLYSHILHHVLDPEAIMSEAKRIIKAGGKIIVTVPQKLGTDANHLRVYDQDKLVELVSKHFSNVQYHNKIGDGHGCTAVNL